MGLRTRKIGGTSYEYRAGALKLPELQEHLSAIAAAEGRGVEGLGDLIEALKGGIRVFIPAKDEDFEDLSVDDLQLLVMALYWEAHKGVGQQEADRLASDFLQFQNQKLLETIRGIKAESASG